MSDVHVDVSPSTCEAASQTANILPRDLQAYPTLTVSRAVTTELDAFEVSSTNVATPSVVVKTEGLGDVGVVPQAPVAPQKAVETLPQNVSPKSAAVEPPMEKPPTAASSTSPASLSNLADKNSESPRTSQPETHPTVTPPTTRRLANQLPQNLSFPRHCITHVPSLEELRSMSFSDYVRKVVLPAAHPYEYEDGETPDFEQECIELTEGIAKISLPAGFWKETSIKNDRTGRGPAFRKGTRVGDLPIHSPIQQNLQGLAGIYEYTFTEEKTITLSDFRDKADKYRERQVGEAVLTDFSQEALEKLEAKFWKRLGPTMEPAWYGADHEGTLFGKDPASGWSLAELDSCLHVLPKLPGVTSPYLYAGMWASVFAAHTEDMNLLSINYLHAGAPKIWYAIAPGPDAVRFEALCEHHFSIQARSCREFLRHKRCLISPKTLQRAGIRYQTAVQMPGEAVITFPAGYHFGFNAGFNIAEATNFGVPEWIPYGRRANVCLCRPDSVRIDMERLTALLAMFEQEKKNEPALSWMQWFRRRSADKEKKRKHGGSKSATKAKKKSGQPKKQQKEQKDFWVEVKTPVSRNGVLMAEQNEVSDNDDSSDESDAERTAPAAESPRQAVEVEGRGRGQRQRQLKKFFDDEAEQRERALLERIQKERDRRYRRLRKQQKKRWAKEIWHLAKPPGPDGIRLNDRVLCMVPGVAVDVSRSDVVVDEDAEDEQCFRGRVFEMSEDHARIRFDGLNKADDAWIALDGGKLFLDGGIWSDKNEKQGIPPRHYWKEIDSKTLANR